MVIDLRMFLDSRPSRGEMYATPDIQPALGLEDHSIQDIYKHLAPSGASVNACFPIMTHSVLKCG